MSQIYPEQALGETELEVIKHAINEFVPVHKFLGITLREARRGYALLHFPFRDEFVGDPRHRRWHGGMLATLIDSAAGSAAITTFTSPEDQVSSIDIRVDYLRTGKPLDLLAEGEIVRDGKNVLFAKMKVWHEETGEVIAEGRGAFRIKRQGSFGDNTEKISIPDSLENAEPKEEAAPTEEE